MWISYLFMYSFTFFKISKKNYELKYCTLSLLFYFLNFSFIYVVLSSFWKCNAAVCFKCYFSHRLISTLLPNDNLGIMTSWDNENGLNVICFFSWWRGLLRKWWAAFVSALKDFCTRRVIMSEIIVFSFQDSCHVALGFFEEQGIISWKGMMRLLIKSCFH